MGFLLILKLGSLHLDIFRYSFAQGHRSWGPRIAFHADVKILAYENPDSMLGAYSPLFGKAAITEPHPKKQLAPTVGMNQEQS